MHRRTAIINQIRGFLLERGITFAKGPANLRNQMPAMLEDTELNISPRLRTLLARVWQEWKQLEIDIADASDEIERGNIYLRRMFIHGARAVLLRVKYDTGGFGQWDSIGQIDPVGRSFRRMRSQSGN